MNMRAINTTEIAHSYSDLCPANWMIVGRKRHGMAIGAGWSYYFEPSDIRLLRNALKTDDAIVLTKREEAGYVLFAKRTRGW